MATTGIWKIEKRLDHVLDYIMNPEKTIKSSYQDLHKLSEYDIFNYNSEEKYYVSALNCLPETAFSEMMDTKSIWNKKGGIIGYHAFQSFKEGEVTPDKAHLIGLKLAEEIWGDRFEVVVATHATGTEHIHNHFVINSVSFKDGKKYHDCHESYALLRHTSDALCQDFGLSIVDKVKSTKRKINYSNYYKGYTSKNNYHILSKQDIDRAVAMAYSYDDFKILMIKMGYEVITRYGKLSIRRDPYKKNIRIERAFGQDYSIDNITERIRNTTAPRVPFLEVYDFSNEKIYKDYKKEKSHGLYGLYKYYCYILGVYPNHNPNKYISPELRIEILKMDEISKQTQLLVSKEIETYEQLLFYKNNLKNDIQILMSQKENLWKKVKRIKEEAEKLNYYQSINDIAKKITLKRKELKVCEGVEKRLPILRKNIDAFEKENCKENRKEQKI